MKLSHNLKINALSKFLWFFALFFLPLSFVSAEEVMRFQSEIEVQSDSSFTVVETITYDFETSFRHGIFRDIPLTHPQEASEWYKDRYISVENLEILMDGETVQSDITETPQNISIKIGDPDEEITGEHIYTISYTVIGGLSYFDDNTVELYWNITGHEWEVPIRRAVGLVSNSSNMLSEHRLCYTGVVGGTDSCTITATSTVVSFTSPRLGFGHGLTIAQEIRKGSVAKVILEETQSIFLWVGGGLFWFIVLGWFVYRYRTKYNPRKTVVSQYQPFEDFKPMFTGVLIDGRLDQKDITAGLLYLAEQGFMKIKKTERKVLLFIEVSDYEVTLLRDIDEVETQFLKDVLLLLFDDYDSVGKTIALSKLKKDTSKLSENQKTLKKLRNDVLVDLEKRGYFERILSIPGSLFIVIGAFFIVPFSLAIVEEFLGSLAVPLIIIVIGTTIILAFGYQRRTVKGYAALNHLKGFKEFLSVTEKERYTFHNAPSKSPEQFMEFLPYAVAFGVEAKWAEVFKDISIPNPEWYDGGGGMQSAFIATSLTNDLGAFSSSFSSSSTPASSGGGSSGGGGGGGGGGSW